MKKIIKNILKILAKGIILISSKINAGRYFVDELIRSILQIKKTVKHDNLEFKFYTPNRLNYFRVDTFSTKEPETQEWINTFKKNGIFWDVGANIGLYSCYAAKHLGCQVYAFEPSVFNLELLTKNIYINSLSEKIIIVPFPLGEETDVKPFHMSLTEWGGALSNFGQSIDYDGLPTSSVLSYQTVGMSIDSCINILNFKKPNYIKLDVDGIEHLILKGAKDTLLDVESLLVEVNDGYEEQARGVKEYLTKAGFKLKEKRQSELIKKSSGAKLKLYNQIWIR